VVGFLASWRCIVRADVPAFCEFRVVRYSVVVVLFSHACAEPGTACSYYTVVVRVVFRNFDAKHLIAPFYVTW